MSPEDIRHFLVVYDPATGEAEVSDLGKDYDAAQDEYARAERENAEHGGSLDVVLLSADSLETIKQTHSSYFSGRDGELKQLAPN